jgi:hypothetical protein
MRLDSRPVLRTNEIPGIALVALGIAAVWLSGKTRRMMGLVAKRLLRV